MEKGVLERHVLESVEAVRGYQSQHERENNAGDSDSGDPWY